MSINRIQIPNCDTLEIFKKKEMANILNIGFVVSMLDFITVSQEILKKAQSHLLNKKQYE